MNIKELYFGGWVTALINVIAMCSAGNEPFIVSGFIIAMIIIFIFCSGIRLMMASALKEKEGEDCGTDWISFGSFAAGSAISTIITIIMFLLG